MLYTSFWSRFELTTSVVIGTDCIGSCKSIYNTITARTAPPIILYIFYVLYIYRQYQLYTLCLVKSDILVLRKFYGKTFLHFSVQTTQITIIVCRLKIRRHMKIYVKDLLELLQVYIYCRGRHGCDRMVVGFTTTYAINAHHHWCEFESRSGWGVQHYLIKFFSDLRQVGGFLQVPRFPPPIKLTATI
jgi:hypothetical protein